MCSQIHKGEELPPAVVYIYIFAKKVEGGCHIFVSLWQCEHVPGQCLFGGESAAVKFDIRHLLLEISGETCSFWWSYFHQLKM